MLASSHFRSVIIITFSFQNVHGQSTLIEEARGKLLSFRRSFCQKHFFAKSLRVFKQKSQGSFSIFPNNNVKYQF